MRYSTKDKATVELLATPLGIIANCCVGASALDKAALEQCVRAFEAIVRWRDNMTEADRRRAFGATAAAQALAMAPTGDALNTPRKLALAAYAAALGRFAMADATAKQTLVAADAAADIVWNG